jgi:hypothetical protein
MRQDAWLLLDGGERRDCALSDISHIGARINIPDSDIIPGNFLLLLAANGTAPLPGNYGASRASSA